MSWGNMCTILNRAGIHAALRVLVVSFILFFVFIIYGRHNFYRDPGSIFFDITRAFERSYSLVREAEAVDWRNGVIHELRDRSNSSARMASGVFAKKGDKPKMCVVFVTAYREGIAQYIDVAISSALAGLTRLEREDLNLLLYIANTNPSLHPAWNSWLDSVVDESFTAGNAANNTMLRYLSALERERKFHEKAALDYCIALRRCIQDSSAPYVAVFEGDVIVAHSWFVRAMAGLRTIQEQYHMTLDEWLDMRLFQEERSTGWASWQPFSNHVVPIFLSVDIAAIIIAYIVRRTKLPFSSFVSPLSILVMCTLTIPGAVILFFQAGKASMLPPSSGVQREDGFGCCNQALLFSRTHVSDLALYLEEKSKEIPHDNAIMEYHRKKRLPRFALYPMMVQHVGFKSIVNPNRRSDQEVWSMAFENLDPVRLKIDHEKMVKQIYGVDAWEPLT